MVTFLISETTLSYSISILTASTFTLSVEVYTDHSPSEKKTIKLTVTSDQCDKVIMTKPPIHLLV